MRDKRQTTNEQLKIELLSQWKLEAESRKNGKKAVRLTAWVVDPLPPLPQCGQENVKISRHICGYFAIS